MRLLIICNPSAGRGQSRVAADAAAAGAAALGWQAEVVPVSAPDVRQRAVATDVVVVAGGDGTVRSMAGLLRGVETPLAVIPTGTENLAAREYGFRVPLERLLEKVGRRRVRQVDVGLVNGECFLVMASAGLDASVVAAVQAGRTGPITHWTYVGPIVRQAWSWRATPCQVAVDGRMVFAGAGQVVVANSRQYASRLDPVRWADPCDGALEVLVLPTGTAAGLAWWAARMALPGWGRQRPPRGAVGASGSQVEVQWAQPVPVQVDGDPASAAATQLVATVEPGALRVLDMRR